MVTRDGLNSFFLQCVVASLELLPVILGGIKCCDSRQGNSVSSMVKCSKMACVGDNLITQTMHKTTRSTSSHTWSNRPGSLPVFCTLCNKNWGGAWEWG